MSLARKEALTAYFLVGPWIVGFIIFTLGPMIASLIFSFMDYQISQTSAFIGLKNYIELFVQDYRFWLSLRVTLTYAVVAIPLGLILGLLLALLLNTKVPGIAVWRTLYYTPSVVSGVAVAVLWAYLFNPRFGVVNWLLSLVNVKGPGWLSDPQWALPALILMSLWGVGGGMIIYLAGLQGIPTTLYEAAEIDGANKIQSFFNITLPLITPVLFYNLVIGIIGTFQIFTSVYIMTAGGPAESTLFYNLYLYNNAFRYQRMGYASALAWVLFIIVLLLTLLVFSSSSAFCAPTPTLYPRFISFVAFWSFAIVSSWSPMTL
jgi:multiple sugar transport system permease protein